MKASSCETRHFTLAQCRSRFMMGPFSARRVTWRGRAGALSVADRRRLEMYDRHHVSEPATVGEARKGLTRLRSDLYGRRSDRILPPSAAWPRDRAGAHPAQQNPRRPVDRQAVRGLSDRRPVDGFTGESPLVPHRAMARAGREGVLCTPLRRRRCALRYASGSNRRSAHSLARSRTGVLSLPISSPSSIRKRVTRPSRSVVGDVRVRRDSTWITSSGSSSER